MIHEAYMPVYIGSRFSLRTGGCTGPPEVVQEALADLKTHSSKRHIYDWIKYYHAVFEVNHMFSKLY